MRNIRDKWNYTNFFFIRKHELKKLLYKRECWLACISGTKELMHCHCGTNNRAPRWTFTDPWTQEVKPGAREESASAAWLAAPAMNARDTTKVYIWRLGTGCEPTLYTKCHSHTPPGKKHNNTWVELLAGNCTTSSTRQRHMMKYHL